MWPTFFIPGLARDTTPPDTDCWTPYFKHEDTVRNQQTTPTIDPDLQIPLEAGGLYHIIGFLNFYCNNSGSFGPDALYLPVYSAAADALIVHCGNSLPGTTNPEEPVTDYRDLTVELSQLGSKGRGISLADSGANYNGVHVDIIIRVETSGTFSIYWGTNSTPGNVTLLESTYLQVRRLN